MRSYCLCGAHLLYVVRCVVFLSEFFIFHLVSSFDMCLELEKELGRVWSDLFFTFLHNKNRSLVKHISWEVAYFSCVKYINKILLLKLLELTSENSRQLFSKCFPWKPIDHILYFILIYFSHMCSSNTIYCFLFVLNIYIFFFVNCCSLFMLKNGYKNC